GYQKIHKDAANRPCWSPNGQMLVTSGVDKNINVLTSHDLQPLHKLQGHTSYVWDVALSPDGNIIASGANDGTVRVWDIASGAAMAILEQKGGAYCVRFSLDGGLLAAMSEEAIHLWRCRD